MPTPIQIEPIGYIHASRAEASDDNWDDVTTRLELDTRQFGPDALAGLDAFSHVEVLFYFHAAKGPGQTGARIPRDNPAWPKVGIFAQRAKDRTNHIGATICRVLSVEGTTLHLAGLDAIDGTPVLDIKPVMQGFLPRGEVHEPGWAAELMKDYW